VRRAPQSEAVVSCRGIEDEAQARNKGSLLLRESAARTPRTSKVQLPPDEIE
jgi:hypothetical protein